MMTKHRQKGMFSPKVPNKMPEGYYSGDKPNPNLRAFVEQHIKERPYDPETDDYDVPAFDKPIETSKATAIYNMHTYWSKKPHDAIRQYIQHYTEPGDLVLDPFCGSGGTALASLVEGRKAIAIDRSPAATFITKNYCTPIEVKRFEKAVSKLLSLIRPYLDILYSVECPRCGKTGEMGYTVYSHLVQCIKCMTAVPRYPKGDEQNSTCQECGTVFSGKEKLVGTAPVRKMVKCVDGCRQKTEIYTVSQDINCILDNIILPEWYCKDIDSRLTKKFPVGLITRQPIAAGANTIADLYTKRNLVAAKILFSAISAIDCENDILDLLKFVFNGIVLNISKMLRETKRAIQSGTYYLPPLSRELHIWNAFSYKAAQISKSLHEINDLINPHQMGLIVTTQSAVDISEIPKETVDYIFTDPPYGAKVQFAEANLAWEVWQGFDTNWWDEEIIVNAPRHVDDQKWYSLMLLSMEEANRVLKPHRRISVCFHGDASLWKMLQDIMALSGFVPEKSAEGAIYIDAREKSYKQRTADNVQLRDLVISFRKPKPGEVTATIAITGNEDEMTFNEKVLQIIRDYLGANPGSTKDRIYDEVVSSMVRSGQMEAHDFNELLSQVAEVVKTPVMKNLFEQKDPDLFGSHEISRWYLKETELAVADAAETASEDVAAEKICTFVEGYLKKHLTTEGVHYSDLFEHYIYAVQDKPRRQLAEFLPDYFYKTEQGTWRLPASEEEEHAKREARVKGLGRRVKRYIAQLELGAAIPDHERPNDTTLAEWIRHCKRAGLYEQGKLLYEKGGLNPDNLPNEAEVNVEEDYQVCARMLARKASEPKRRSRKKPEK
jgi:DNA modification methylase